MIAASVFSLRRAVSITVMKIRKHQEGGAQVGLLGDEQHRER